MAEDCSDGPPGGSPSARRSRARSVAPHQRETGDRRLDEAALPAVGHPRPDGLGWEDLDALLRPLLATPNPAGVRVADFDAAHPEAEAYAERIAAALARAWP